MLGSNTFALVLDKKCGKWGIFSYCLWPVWFKFSFFQLGLLFNNCKDFSGIPSFHKVGWWTTQSPKRVIWNKELSALRKNASILIFPIHKVYGPSFFFYSFTVGQPKQHEITWGGCLYWQTFPLGESLHTIKILACRGNWAFWTTPVCLWFDKQPPPSQIQVFGLFLLSQTMPRNGPSKIFGDHWKGRWFINLVNYLEWCWVK